MSDGATGTSHAGAVKERAGRGLSAHLNSASKDIVALGIAFAAIIMFVGTGSSVLVSIARSISGHGVGPDKMLTNALLLNIALIIFGWRRYRELTGFVSVL